MEAVRELILALEARIGDLADHRAWYGEADAHGEQLECLRERYEARFVALGMIDDAVARLREMTSPSTILSRAPRELCMASQLDRAVFSLIRDGFLVAEAAYFRDDAVGAAKALEALAAVPPRLEHPLIETELLRRRRATIVIDAQVHPRVHKPTADIMGWQSYLAAPVVVGGEVIGSIHADTTASGRALDALDGDILWSFATGLGEVYETASLRRALRDQQSEMRQFLEWLSARSSELNDAAMQLVAEPGPPPEPPGQLDAVARAAGVDQSRLRRRPNPAGARGAATGGPRRDQQRHRRAARDLRGHSEVPRQQCADEAAREQSC